jgi:hypothetical protein
MIKSRTFDAADNVIPRMNRIYIYNPQGGEEEIIETISEFAKDKTNHIESSNSNVSINCQAI